ncbi:MAG TPA: UDP-N-acetylglucosamine 1-carboxyvinyltransferase [Gemmatimonadaceae bacterium]|nr:UDP-N-acetylglucosamine 1-carboxyvinyltransferase [Gemmatimonadaceae bacterium]
MAARGILPAPRTRARTRLLPLIPAASLRYIVEGGNTLAGSIHPSGNKNAALPIIAAALLTDKQVTLENVPHIRDVETLVELIRSLGVTAEWTASNTLVIEAKVVQPSALDPELCARIRASILLAGPLLARCGAVTLPPPGGDVIGRRRVDTHFLALEQLGARVELGAHYALSTRGLRGADVFLDEPSVTATENALMAASLATGTTTLSNAASEPHVQDLAHFLVALGATIEGIGTNTITIHGAKSLHGTTHRIGPDHIEVGSFIGLAAVTRSELRIVRAGVEHLRSTRLGFERLGIECTVVGDDLIVSAKQSRTIRADLGGHVPKLEDQPWPAFPADLMSIAIVTATQCDGLILMHEKMFESRLFFVDKLIGMGARIVLCDPHRALVAGPSALHGSTLDSPDIRAGMAMLLAALCATGTSTINNVGQIERGYERIDERLRALGARITRVEDRRG